MLYFSLASLWRVLRYMAAGISSLALDLVLQLALRVVIGIPVELSIVLSYELALLAHFFITNRWVFGQQHYSLRRLVQFHIASLAAFGITSAVTAILIKGPPSAFFSTGLGPEVAKIIGTGAAFGWSFATSFYWIWRPRLAGTGLAESAETAAAAGTAAAVVTAAASAESTSVGPAAPGRVL